MFWIAAVGPRIQCYPAMPGIPNKKRSHANEYLQRDQIAKTVRYSGRGLVAVKNPLSGDAGERGNRNEMLKSMPGDAIGVIKLPPGVLNFASTVSAMVTGTRPGNPIEKEACCASIPRARKVLYKADTISEALGQKSVTHTG